MPTPGELIAKYIEVRDYVKKRQDAFDAELKPYTEGLTAIEGQLFIELENSGLENLKSESGTAYKVRTMHAKVADKDTLMTFVAEHGHFELLTAAVAKDAIKDFMEEHQNNPPPGVDVTYTTRINIRRS